MGVKNISHVDIYIYIYIHYIYYVRVKKKKKNRRTGGENDNSFEHRYPARFDLLRLSKRFGPTDVFNEVYFLDNYFTTQFQQTRRYTISVRAYYYNGIGGARGGSAEGGGGNRLCVSRGTFPRSLATRERETNPRARAVLVTAELVIL